MSNINEIVDVQISIESPAADAASFSNLLIVATKPEGVSVGNVSVSDPKELETYGYTDKDEAYKAAIVAFDQRPHPAVLHIVNRNAEETVDEVMNRALATVAFYGVSFFTEEKDDFTALAKWCEANDKLFDVTWITGEPIIDFSKCEHAIAFHAADEEDNKYAGVAFMSHCFGYEPGSETWANKTLYDITSENLSNAQVAAYKEANTNYYVRMANVDVTRDGVTGTGEWIDVIRFRDWMTNAVQMAVFNALRSNAKVPFNDDGITLIKNAIEAVLSKGQQIGGIDVDQYENGEVVRAYSVSVPRASSLTPAQRRSRKLTDVTFEARLAGAIHNVVIRGTLTN